MVPLQPHEATVPLGVVRQVRVRHTRDTLEMPRVLEETNAKGEGLLFEKSRFWAANCPCELAGRRRRVDATAPGRARAFGNGAAITSGNLVGLSAKVADTTAHTTICSRASSQPKSVK